MPSGPIRSGVHGPSATTTSPASSGPAAVSTRQSAVGAMQRARVAGERKPAERGKARRIGARQRQRIADAHRAGPMHGVAEHRLERRLERARRVAVERHIGDAEARGELELARLRRKRLVAAVEFQPAGMAQIFLGAGFRAQRLVLGDRAGHQRPDDLRGLDQPRRLRRGAEGEQPRRDFRQKRQMIIGFRRALERNAQERRKARRERRRKDRVAFDDAGIAVGRALARPAAIDQRDRDAALGEMHAQSRCRRCRLRARWYRRAPR